MTDTAQTEAKRSSDNRRRLDRLPVRLNATLDTPGGEKIDGIISDFCRAGIYFRFANPDSVGRHLPPLPGSETQATFTTGRGRQARHHALTCRVAHISETGIGLFIPSMPLASYQDLSRDYAAAQTASRVPNGVRNSVVLMQCHEQIRAAMPDVFQDVFERLGRLLSSARLEVSFMEQSRYDHAVQLFTARRPGIEGRCVAMLDATLHAIEQGREPLESGGKPGEADQLSLVEDAEFDDWLAQTTVTTQVEARLHQDIGLLQLAYESASGLPLSRKSLPFGPETLSRCFGHGIALLDIQPDIRQIAYKALGATLRVKLPTLYDALNAMLAPISAKPARRIIHKFNAQTGTTGTRTTPNHEATPALAPNGPASALPDLPEINQLLEKLIGEFARGQTDSPHTQDVAEAIPYNLSTILMALNQPGSPHGQAPDGMVATATSRPPTGTGTHQAGLSSPTSLIQTARSMRHAYQRLADPAMDEATRDRSAAGLPKAGALAIRRELLDSLQQWPASAPDSGGMGSPPLSLRLDAHLARTLPAPLPPLEQEALDDIAQVLDRVSAELPVSSQIEALLRTLERPLLKLAITDPGSLSAPHQQARMMMSLLDQYAIATNDLGRFFDPKLQQFLGTLLERVRAGADKDPSIFAKANGYLERMLVPIQAARQRRIALLQETCEGKERVRSARSRTNDMLEHLLGNRAVPIPVIHLLDLGWRQYLVLLELRQGINHPEWHRGKAALSMLLEWLDSPAGRAAPSPQSVAELLAYIEQHLTMVNVDASRIQDFIEALGNSLRDLKLGKVPGKVRVPSGRFLAKTGLQETASPAVLDGLRVGLWWNFLQNGLQRPMQLIWLSQPPGLCAFANRSATQKLELSLTELEQRLASGAATPSNSKDMPLFERTAQIIIDDAYQQLSHDVSHDPDTGLINRRGFMQKLHHLAALREDQTHYVCILEFDQFREIYNNCGVEAGDVLSRQLSAELSAQVTSADVVASFQDGLFALLLYRRNRIQILEFAGKLLKVFQNFRFDHGQKRYSIGVNFGLAEYVSMHDTPEEVVKNADSACISARKAGRNRWQRYDPSDEQLRMQQFLMDLAGRIDQIVQEHGLYLRCQRVEPLDMDSGLAPYYEILLGIRDRSEDIRPMKFLSAVERWQRGHEIDMWVVENTFSWIEAHQALFEASAGFAINLSPSSLDSGEFKNYLQGKLNTAGFSLDKLTFEISESSTLDTYRVAQEFIRLVRRFGCKFALDDVGSGFSSFAHLKTLHIDVLKIDGLFVRECVNNPADLAMVNSMNEIGHALGMKTVAEFVETEDILASLRSIGVDYVQGYAIHTPMPLDQLAIDPPTPESVSTTAPHVETRPATFPMPCSETAAKPHTWRNPNSGGLGQP